MFFVFICNLLAANIQPEDGHKVLTKDQYRDFAEGVSDKWSCIGLAVYFSVKQREVERLLHKVPKPNSVSCGRTVLLLSTDQAKKKLTVESIRRAAETLDNLRKHDGPSLKVILAHVLEGKIIQFPFW